MRLWLEAKKKKNIDSTKIGKHCGNVKAREFMTNTNDKGLDDPNIAADFLKRVR